MLWMSGSGLNIFSIMITGMAVVTPMKAIMGVKQTFAKLDDGTISLTLPKLMFIGLNILGLCMAVWKCRSLGLIPLHSSDWTGYLLSVKENLETSGGGEAF